MPVPFLPPAAEVGLGMGYYVTDGGGTGGRTKVDPEDFRVREISHYPVPHEDGEFTILRVAARDWEQHELVRRLSDLLRLGPGAMAWAGTKDRRAVTEQLLSYPGAPRPLEAAPLRGIEVLETYRARRGLALGQHYGNIFDIAIREAPGSAEEVRGRWMEISEELRRAGSFPNFFGPQRFGEVRPVTHRVGRALVAGDTEAAVEIYLAELTESESPEGREARGNYAAGHDAVRALREFPPHWRFERTLLDHLARGQGADRALRALPRELRQLFVHAYQSLLFNRYLTARRAAGLPTTVPEPGDCLLRVARDGTLPSRDPIPVSEDNLEEARSLVGKGRAVLAGPLVGSSTPESRGRPGELLEALLQEESLERGAFDLPRQPEVASEGAWRPLEVPVPPLSFEPADRPSVGDPGAYRMRFALPKGSYATVLLREYLKAGKQVGERPGPDGPRASNQA
ncbi:MAG: tRNA pseudouridine(13) synthase TruD [Thermoplasmata archaeon]